MHPSVQSSASRFWRGAREPWVLFARLRTDGPLWRRFVRVQAVQLGVTLVLALGIFRIGKEGSEAWSDAFGSDASLPDMTAVASPGAPPAAPAPPGAATPPGRSRDAASSRTPAPAAPAAPAPVRSPSSPTRAGAGTPGLHLSLDDDDDDDEATSETPDEDATSAEEAVPPPGPTDGAARGAEPAATGATPAEATGERLTEDDIANAPEGQRADVIARFVKQQVADARRSARKDKAAATARTPEETLADLRQRITHLATASHALAGTRSDSFKKAHKVRLKLEEALARITQRAEALAAAGGPTLDEADRQRLATARADLVRARQNERSLSGRIGALLALLAAIYAAVSIAQTIVLAFSRDFHDALSRDLSLLVHVAPEDPPLTPRIRLDLPWVKRKADRRIRFFIAFLPGPLLAAMVGALLPLGKTWTAALTTVWSAYWWVVMTAAQSSRAWTAPAPEWSPVFVRGWERLTRPAILRWMRWWSVMAHRMSRRFRGPFERIEEQPAEFAGLALSRAVALVPLVKLLVRPVFPVASARLLVEHAATARLPVPVTAEDLARATSVVEDAEARAHSGVRTA